MTLGISIGSTPITGVYVGGTLATGVYFGSTKIWPASAGITFVDACTPVSSATSPSSLNLGLPAAAQAGDTVLADIISNVNQTGGGTYSNSGPAGSTKFVADTSFEWGGLHPGVGSAYAVRLTATDIANGYVTFGFVNSGQVAIRGAVWRGVSETPIDVAAGVASSSAATSNPFTFAAPGITPVTDGCTIVAGAGVLSTTTTALTDPSGYTVADVGNDINALQQFAYQKQTTAGPTGDVSMTFGPDSTTNVQGWFAWLVALRPANPAITLDATFPTNLHVGSTGSFDITATELDGATGSLTVAGSSLPDGMSVGATTDNGDGTFTATVTYDLTTAQDVTSSFSATGGSVAATALTHEFNVQAAASDLQVVEVKTVNPSAVISSSSGITTVLTDVQIGDSILVLIQTSLQPSAYAFSDGQNSYTKAPLKQPSGSQAQTQAAITSAVADAASLTVRVIPNASTRGVLTVYHLRGATLTLDAANVAANTSGNRPDGTVPYTTDPYNTSGRALVLATLSMYQTGDPGITVSANGYTVDSSVVSKSDSHYAFVAMHKIAATALSGETFSFESTSTNNAYRTYVIYPFTY